VNISFAKTDLVFSLLIKRATFAILFCKGQTE